MYEIEDKVLAILFSLLIFLNAIVIKKITGTFLIPAGVFALSWFLFTFIPLVVLFETPINPLTILYIFTTVFVYSLSATFFNWRSCFRCNLKKSLTSSMFDSRFLEVAIYVSAIAAISFSFMTILTNGFTFEQIVLDLVNTSGQYAAVRGTEGMEYGAIGMLSVMFTYVGPVLAGFRFYSPNKKWFFIIAIVPSMLTMITQSSKLTFFVSILFYLSGIIISKIYAKQMGLPGYSAVLKIIFSIILLSPLVLISFISRLGEFDLNNISFITTPLLFSISSYTMGQIYAFSDFFSFTIGASSMSTFKDDFFAYGAFTFASIFEMLGIGKTFPPGMYDETGWHKDVFQTNIFTFFRGLIYDFGVFGSLTFIFLFGFLSHLIMWHVLTRKRAFFTLAALISINMFIFMGYLMSIFVARYVFLVTFVVWLLLSINSYIYSTRHFSNRRNGKTQII